MKILNLPHFYSILVLDKNILSNKNRRQYGAAKRMDHHLDTLIYKYLIEPSTTLTVAPTSPTVTITETT